MVKPKKSYHFGGGVGHHNLMIKNMAVSLITNERIKTTTVRAKQVQPLVDRMMRFAKQGDLNARRLALAELNNEQAVRKLFSEIAPRYESRNSGYTRIIRVGFRQGDSAEMVQLEFV